jgi:hypothetical protein
MKRLVLLSIALMLLLASCVWTYQFSPIIGRRYILVEPDKVIFYKEPSIKSESFQVVKNEKFRTEALVCSENRFTCVFDIFNLKEIDSGFFKIILESGKEGYLSTRYFFYLPYANYIISKGSEKYLSRFLFRTDYDKVWNAALDTLDESGYVIMQMDKLDGYISTGKKEGTSSRSKVSMRLTRERGGVMVRVNVYSEELRGSGEESYWREIASGGGRASMIRDKMALKLGVDPWHPIK